MGKKDVGQIYLQQRITLPWSARSILYHHVYDHRDGATTACYTFNESNPGKEYRRIFLCVLIAYLFDKKKEEEEKTSHIRLLP